MPFYTLPNTAKEPTSQNWTAQVELLTEREHLALIEPAVGEVVKSVYKARQLVSKNSYLDSYDAAQQSAFGFCVEANNLCGGVMQ